ncbi:hypothetical protein Tco_0355915 [Tanacetum coccineum]
MSRTLCRTKVFVGLVFFQETDPIACSQQAMLFNKPVASSRFPSLIESELRTIHRSKKPSHYSRWQGYSATISRESKVPNSETYDMDNQSVLALQDFEQSPVMDFTDNEISTEQVFWFHILNPTVKPSYSPPVIVEVPSELPKVSLVNASLKKLKFHLTQFDSVVKKRTTPSALEEGEWGFEHTKTIFNNEIIPFLKSLKDIFNVFDKDLLNETTEVQTVYDQMDAAVQ